MKPDSNTSPDDYQQAWQAHSSQQRVTVDADLLLKQVQQSQWKFRSTIFWRDFGEVGVALVMLPLWMFLGVTFSLPWTWYLTVPALMWVIGFFLVDRVRHKQKGIGPDETLLESVQESLTQLEHQIWLLRNVFWWYLLPFTIAISAFFAHVAWSAWVPSEDVLAALAQAVVYSILFVVLFAVYGCVYYVNQYAVRTQLEPRRQELLKLLTSLRDETTSGVSGEYPILMSADGIAPCCSPRRRVLACLCAAALLLIGVGGILLGYRLDPSFRQKAPFVAVRWQQSQPEIKVGGEWFKLVSLDGLSASEIVAFSKRTYGNKWRKRFEEDLVEVLAGMGHVPKDTVRLVVMPLNSQETRTLENVPMTRANRRAIREAAQARERGRLEQPERSLPHSDDAEAPPTKLSIGLRQEKYLVGRAAMVTVDGKVVATATDSDFEHTEAAVWQIVAASAN